MHPEKKYNMLHALNNHLPGTNFFRNIVLGMVFFSTFLKPAFSLSTDTISISLEQAEARFLKENLSLLAARFQIDMAHAQVIQSKIIPNPSVYIEQNIYNFSNKKYFDMSASGESILQVQQLVSLAGKRNKQIQLSKVNQSMAEAQLFDLLRTLKLQLHTTFYDLYYRLQLNQRIQYQIDQLQRIVAAQRNQFDKGNTSLKEVVRLEAGLLDLQNDWQMRRSEILSLESDLKMMLGWNSVAVFVLPIMNEKPYAALPTLSISSLLDTAYSHRSDLQLAQEQIHYSESNLRLQKATGVPDMRLGYTYDKNGNFIPNYHAVSLGFDLPIFNRNQGNIQMARIGVRQSETLYTIKKQQVGQEIIEAYQNLLYADSLIKVLDAGYTERFEKVMQGMTENYIRKNIGLVEYLDYYDSYKTALQQVYQARYNRLLRIEEINFTTGTNTLR